ncbi:MAG: pyridoxal phosphate-dependent aminotransferase [Oscillospiraceae bacterium]|nr:pyridoxal phosphate-dependent aminotransferase [Oscillospiraceae bacterium]
MKYDFDSPTERRGTYSLKWEVAENELPMWVADMDFPAAPEITRAISERAAHGVFGYTNVPDEWYAAYTGWWKERHGFEIKRDWLMFCTGVVPAISSIVRKLTTVGENVLVQTPVYNIFFNSIANNGRNVLENPLIYENGSYRIDFADLEAKLSDPQTSLMLLCDPQNPGGVLWDRETLERIGGLCRKYHVVVLSDEIHCDLVSPGREYIPFASVSEDCMMNSVTCIAPTKAFNLAGLQTAAVYAADKTLRHKVWRGLNTDECAEPNVFAVTAAIAAFTQGGDWLDQLRGYIAENRRTTESFLAEKLPQVRMAHSDATYLFWLDCSEITDSSRQLADFIRQKTGLYLSAGEQYRGNGRYFLRLNAACPRSVLLDGLERLRQGVLAFMLK